MTSTVKITGMSCNHCVMAVKNAVSPIDGVKSVDVDLGKGEAVIDHDIDIDMAKVHSEIEKAGYKVG